jgi:hypothetical protein
VELSNGGTVQVRRIKRTTRDRLLAVAGVKGDDSAAAAQFLQLIVRTAVVGAEGLTNADTEQPYQFKTVRHPQLGNIADEALYDAVPSDKDLAAISQAAMPDSKLSEGQQGN